MQILGDLLRYSSPGPLRSPRPCLRGKEVGHEMTGTSYFWAPFGDWFIPQKLHTCL